MRLASKTAFAAVALSALVAAQPASAQSLRGFRGEVQGGIDRFYSEGNHHDKLALGGAAGVDFDLGGFVLGPEITFLWAPNENKTIDGPGLGGLAERKSFQEWGLALRAGVDISPSTLIYGKVGYVKNEQRNRFTPINPTNGLLDS